MGCQRNTRTTTAQSLGYSVCISFNCLIVCLLLIGGASDASANYDPESIIDEIPIISARSLSPEITGRYEAHRRNSEPDLEEVDDYDDDERQRGSSSNQHDTYENPAYGESRRSAKEADDIENFFDRHVGPNEAEMTSSNNGADPDDKYINNNNNDLPLLGPERRRVDDPFELAAAASSPLATIFQTLIAAHKRPIVIETSDLAGVLGSDSSSSSGTNDAAEQSSSSSSSSASSSLNQPLANAQSTTSWVSGSSPTVAALGATGQTLPLSPIASYLSPIAAPSSLAAYGQQMLEQAASGAAAAAAGAGSSGDDGAQETSSADGGSDSSSEDGGQIQEIYIGRRPSLMSHFQSYSPTNNNKLSHQSSNAAGYWRGNTPASTGVGASSANVMSRPQMMMMATPSMMMSNKQMSAYNADYSRYPVAASYAHQQESADNGGDDGTVEYNLSFGGGNSGSGASSSGGDDGPEEMSSLSVDSQAGASDESSAPQMPAGYGRMRQMSGTNQYMNSYNPYQQQLDPSQSEQYQQQLQQAYQQQQQQHAIGAAYGGRKNTNNKKNNANYATKSSSGRNQYAQRQQNMRHQSHAARYHKDPSESVVQPVNYGQFRPQQMPPMMLMNNQRDQQSKQQQHYNQMRQQQQDASEQLPSKLGGGSDWHERQRYLAMLNREIKSTPQYENGVSGNNIIYTKDRATQSNYGKKLQQQQQSDDAQVDGPKSSDDDVYSNVQSESRYPTRVFQKHQQRQLVTSVSSQQPISSGTTTITRTNHETPSQKATDNGNQLRDNNIDTKSNHRNNNNSTSLNQNLNTPLEISVQSTDARVSSSTDSIQTNTSNKQHLRVKRDDSDDRDDADDDGVWVEDDDDDDNSRQSSDVNKTSQEPDEESASDQGGDESGPQSSYNVQPIAAQVAGISLNHPGGIITRPHSYEVSPDDAYGYGAYP